jgi:hypothetical protein
MKNDIEQNLIEDNEKKKTRKEQDKVNIHSRILLEFFLFKVNFILLNY